MKSSRLLIAALLSACSLAAPARSRAQPAAASNAAPTRPTTVTLLQDDCGADSYDTGEFAKLLRIELQALGVTNLQLPSGPEQVSPSAAGVAVLHMRCGKPADHLSIELADLATGKQLQRELVVTDLELKARPRALSLAVALLIESSWLELATRKSLMSESFALPYAMRSALRRRLLHALETEPVESPAPPKAAKPSAVSEARAALAVLMAARSFPGRSTGLVGADLAYLPTLASTRVLLDLEALAGSQEISDGAGLIADMHMFWLAAGLGLLWTSTTRPELALGPFARVGYGLANVTDARFGYRGHSGGSVIAAFGISAILRAAISTDLDLWAGFDLGYVPGGVVFLFDRNRTAGMSDVTMAVRLGLGFGL